LLFLGVIFLVQYRIGKHIEEASAEAAPIADASDEKGMTTVPEPGTWVMLASGLVAVSWQARRKLLQKGSRQLEEKLEQRG
jgi:hypothetical protein